MSDVVLAKRKAGGRKTMGEDIEKIIVSRTDGEVTVALLPHKDGSGWSFVNLSKGHICPCKFTSKEEGMADLDVQPKVLNYKVGECK